MSRRFLRMTVAVALALAGCGDNSGGEAGVRAVFDLDSPLDSPKTFLDAPFPSDLRRGPDGRPDLTGYPNPRNSPLVAKLLAVAGDRDGWPVLPVAYFRFDGALAPRSLGDPIAADPGSRVLLIEIDADAPASSRLLPAVARTLDREDWSPDPTLAVAPFPGVVLRGDTTHAVVVMSSLGDAEGRPLAPAAAIRAMAGGDVPGGARGAEAAALFAPLWPALEALGVDPGTVVTATVFTTHDVVARTAELAVAVASRDQVSITGVALDPDDGADHLRYCELHASTTQPQYQAGTPPFDDEGLFEIGDDGLPRIQRSEDTPIVVAIPRGEMPASGYPLMLYFHGSGGVAATVVDAGPASEPDGELAAGLGPAHVVAEHGIASAGAALPLSPDRLPGAADIEYLNFNNLPAFRDTFRQGILEQRMLLDALLELRIDPAALAGCPGPTLPAGASEFFFDPDQVVASGQSMGGMYTNLIAPLDPRIRAAVPTGAGGFWNKMILETRLISGAADFVSLAIGTSPEYISFVHPGMHVLLLAWEAVEPGVYMPRLARRPLPGMAPRPVYQPVGEDDIYFPTTIFDAAAVAYGHQQAGDEHWPEMQRALEIAGTPGILEYPVAGNLSSEAGAPTTGVVVQYPGDGIRDAHFIYAQLEEVKRQYGCFFASFLATGVATVPAPSPLEGPCPGL